MSSNWRNDIQGLRAIAILPVLLNHFNSSLIPGGYLGVDLFFVISGYLISKQIKENDYSKHLDLIKVFLLKRYYRIFPSLIICVFIFTLIFTFFLIPGLHKPYFIIAALSLVGLSNIGVWIYGADYFSPTSNTNPFLHLWSVSLEDQFYVFFILLLYICFKSKKNISNILILIITFLSFSIFYLFPPTKYLISFYNLPFRFWEFGIGALLVYLPSKLSTKISKNARVFKPISLLIILTTYFWGNDVTISPVFYLLFTLSCASLLISEEGKLGIISQFLSTKPFQSIGLLAYSLYLIHFPILKLIEFYFDTTSQINISALLLYLLITLIIAWLNYIFIEKRFINYYKNKFSISEFKVSHTRLISISLVITILATQLFLFANSYYKTAYYETAALNRTHPLYTQKKSQSISEKKNIYIIGDSHSQMFLPVLYSISQELSLNFFDYTGSGCLVGYNISYKEANGKIRDQCKEMLNTFFDTILPKSKNSIVFIGLRSTAYLLPSLISREDKPIKGILLDTQYVSISNPQIVEKYFLHLERTIIQAKKLNTIIIFLAPIPEAKVSTFRCLYNPSKEECSVSDSLERSYRKPIMHELRKLNLRHENFIILDLYDKIVKNNKLSNILGQKIIYRDDDHLSDSFCLSLKPEFDTLITKLLKHTN